jgi:hypothetical protein
MPGVSGVTVVTNARAFYTPRAAAGASGARHSLRPLLSEGANFLQSSGASRREKAKVCLSFLGVIARSEATKQSILSWCCRMDCFASLAMTALRQNILAV